MTKSKETRLFLLLGCFFVANAVVAEFIGVKIFSVEDALGINRFNISMFGVPNLSFNMSAGVLLWPVVFIMTDIINEYFGVKGVRLLSYIAAGLITYAFIMVFLSMNLPGSDFWINKSTPAGNLNMDQAFNNIFGQGLWIIIGSISAFVIGQIADVTVFHQIKRRTGEKALWLRATGSTVISQFMDSFVVIFIAFYLNPNYNWSFSMVMAIGLVGYTYKFIVAVCLTPVLYLVHYLIDRYLGAELSDSMRRKAAGEE